MGPTIIIGLGGLGSEIVSMVQGILDVQGNFSEELRRQVSLAIVDTDVNQLREKKKKGFRGTIIQISDNMTVEKYLHYDKEAENSWFPSCQILSKKSLTEGAGQVRAISRLALNMALQKGSFAPLYEAIDKLHLLSEHNSEQATKVIIVSSLAGGTGSGIFLPIAMHLQDYLRRTYRNTEPLFKGFFIMPSMFDYVVKGGAERKSLRANAYASIKELNAFTLMRDRQISSNHFPQMKIELMDDQGCKQVYRSSPYDLCFLFEKQNKIDKHLDTYDESKKNVAECIWMQTLNPLLELNSSLEDNLYKIVSTTDGKQYQRFAGMGISRIEYPYAELMNYIAILTASRVLGDKYWYAADQYWKDACTESEDINEASHDISRESLYIKYAETTTEEYWRLRIDEVIRKKWVETYIDAVDRICMEEISKKENYQKIGKDIDMLLNNADESDSQWPMAIGQLEQQYSKVCQVVEEERGNILQELYLRLKPGVRGKKNRSDAKDYELERWLFEGIRNHTPVENRYFLYQLHDLLKKRCEKTNQNQTEAKRQADKAKEDFDIRSGDYKDIVKGYRAKKERKLKQKEILDAVRSAKGQKVSQMENEIKYHVYSFLLGHVNTMIEGYEKLLDICNDLVGRKEKELRNNLEMRFRSYDGHTVRMVCTSANCLDKMRGFVVNNMDRGKNEDNFAGMLCESVIEPLKGDKQKLERKLLDFWFDQYKKASYDQDPLDVDVLTALKNEAIWEKNLDSDNLDDTELAQIREYIENVIGLVRDVFSNAFIRVPDVRQWHIMEMNTYPAEVPNEEKDPFLNRIVKECLREKNGVQNQDPGSPKYIESRKGSPKYRIDFYRAFFGVAAGDVSAFLNPQEGSPIRSGESFDAYAGILHRLDDVNQHENFLTPHIDKNWHKISQMPELSEERDRERKVDLLEAAFFGLVKEVIVKDKDSGYHIVQKVDNRNFDRREGGFTAFSKLAAYMDENPFIIYGLWNQLQEETQYGKRPEAKWEKFLELRQEITDNYCTEQVEHGSPKNDTEGNIREACMRLVFQIWIETYGYTGEMAVRAMMEKMEGIVTENEVRSWLAAKFKRKK